MSSTRNPRAARISQISRSTTLAASSWYSYPIRYPRGVALFSEILALCVKRGFEPNVVQETQQASTSIGWIASSRKSGRPGDNYYAAGGSPDQKKWRPHLKFVAA
ncbi:hypothetical protein OKW37_000465 [Paraburkholderia sp. MM5482-R2]